MIVAILIIIGAQFLVFLALLAYLLTGRLTQPWVEHLLMQFFGISLLQHHQFTSKISPETRLIASNHRTFADFFIDSSLAGYVTHLSRWMVALVLPMTALYAFFTGRVLFFWRGHTKRIDLQKQILTHQKNHPFPTIFYPEQHRSIAKESLPLRHGVLKICYENNMPIQIMITSNKEKIFNEKTGDIGWNIRCHFGITEPLIPKNFSEYQLFFEAFEQQWLDLWHKVTQPLEKDFTPYTLPKPEIKYHFTKAWFGFWGIFLLLFLSYYVFNMS
jgi:1-acyl-sn-glycerol-3-phosphate acyltransferase